MADPERRHPANTAGAWFVDTTCIDCDASRQCAPSVFAVVDGQSVVVRQPEGAVEELAATRALVACPTGSIGVVGRRPATEGIFPHELDRGLYYLGYTARASFGANAYFATHSQGGLMIDAPRFTARLVRWLEREGGVARILLTHRDDVADAERYAAHFGARSYIHEADRSAAPWATDVLAGLEPTLLADALWAIPCPGHTRGSVVYELDARALFTGDSLYWSRSAGALSAFHDACWYSWAEQTESLARLVGRQFEWVLPGHGDRRHAPNPELCASLLALVARMRAGDPALEGWGY